MTIDSIRNGIVIDHITAGKAMQLYQILKLDKVDASVALLNNVSSGKLGRKDIIKIDTLLELDWDLIGYVDPSITVNIIKDGVRVEKRQLKLPEVIRDKLPLASLSIFLISRAKYSYAYAFLYLGIKSFNSLCPFI